MAITLVGIPQLLNPAHNPNYYIYDSNNKTKLGFSYVIDLYYSGTTTKFYEGRVKPHVVNGQCVVNIQRILASLLTNNFDSLAAISFSVADKTFVRFDVKIGEEFLVDYTAASFANDSGLLEITTSAANTFVVGDQIEISGCDVPTYNGVHTIVTVTSSTEFTINAPFDAGITQATVTYADKRKTITRDLRTETGQIAFNGADKFSTFRTWTTLAYQCDATNTGKFLTSAPRDGYTITTSQFMRLLLYAPDTTNLTNIYFENSNGDVLRRANNTLSNRRLINIRVGAGNLPNLTVISGTAPLIKPDTKWYDVYVAENTTRASEKFRIYIDHRCAINPYEIVFMDRLGSLNSFAFQLREEISGDINRSTYKKLVEPNNGYLDPYTYNTTEAGATTYNVDVNKRYTLTTNWMGNANSIYFEELLSSPFTWLKIGGSYFACVVKESSYETKLQNNKNLINYTITVELAVNEAVNG
jgi:hypothetical protein